MDQHDFENGLTTIKLLSKSISPSIRAMLLYIESEKAFHVVSEPQIEIIKRALQTIIKETELLEKSSGVLSFSSDREKNE